MCCDKINVITMAVRGIDCLGEYTSEVTEGVYTERKLLPAAATLCKIKAGFLVPMSLYPVRILLYAVLFPKIQTGF